LRRNIPVRSPVQNSADPFASTVQNEQASNRARDASEAPSVSRGTGGMTGAGVACGATTGYCSGGPIAGAPPILSVRGVFGLEAEKRRTVFPAPTATVFEFGSPASSEIGEPSISSTWGEIRKSFTSYQATELGVGNITR